MLMTGELLRFSIGRRPLAAALRMNFKTAISSTRISVRGLARIASAAEPSGCYTVCELSMPPALVLGRMFDVLSILDPVAHARLMAPGGPCEVIPPHVMDDANSTWWSGPDGAAVIGGLITALNDATKPQYACVLETDGRIALAPLPRARLDGTSPSGVRSAVRHSP